MTLRVSASVVLAIGLLCCCAAPAAAGDKATTVTIQAKDLLLQDVLKQISAQSGQSVADRRSEKTNPKLNLTLINATFLHAADTVARAAGASLALHEADGVVALVDGKRHEVPSSFHGLFRASLKRLSITDDLDAGQRYTKVLVELAWEPRLRPFRIVTGPAAAVFGKDAAGNRATGKETGGVEVPVASPELSLRLPAAERSALTLEKLHGTVHVVAATEMLTFRFDRLKELTPKMPPLQAEPQQGIRVRVTHVTAPKGADAWTVDVVIEHPPGGPAFESYQLAPGLSWVKYDSVALVREVGGKTERLAAKAAETEERKVTSTYAHVVYRFPPGTALYPRIDQWKLEVRTAGRLVELEVPFVFENVKLP
jgi:hypothetical protein